ncbi:hypothetical protein ACVINW_006330 [Bradyrhizobium sp. USDA 4461]
MSHQEVQPADPAAVVEVHNRVFEQLIDENPDDEHILVGVVAYFYYKAAKREWVINYCENHGRPPTDVELRAYISSWTAMRINGVREEANVALTSYASYILDKERPKIVEDALKHRSFWRESGIACFGAFLWTVMLIVFAVILKLAHIDLLAILQNVGH